MNDKILKPTIIVGAALLIGLVGLSLNYWLERVIMVDAAFQVFSVIFREDWAIQVQRFGAVIVQAFPLAGIKAGWSLSTILQSYSLAFTLYPLVLFILLAWPIKNYRMALALALFYGLTQVHTFFWIQSELIIGTALGIFLLGIIDRWPRPSWKGIALQTMLLITVVYCHPLAIFPFGFGLVFLGFQQEKRSSTWYYVLFILSICIIIYKHWIAPIGGYDAKAMSMFDGFEERLPNLFKLDSSIFFGGRILSTYYMLPAALAVLTVYYWSKKLVLKWFLVVVSLIVWLLLILTTYYWGGDQFYIESYYLVLGVILGIPLAYDCWPKLPKWWMGAAALILISGIRIGQIVDASKDYTARLEWNKAQLEKMETMPERRFIIPRNYTPTYLLKFDWAVGYETLLLSSLPGPTHTQTFIIAERDEQIPQYQAMTRGFPTPFGLITEEQLNRSPYFQLNDTIPPLLLTNQ